jgi:DNA topoisomerase-1
MSNALIVVESPTKARTIKRYVGKEYDVVASVGHIKDLPKSRLGVDVGRDFEPEYEVIDRKTKVIREIKRAAGRAREIYLAPDPDREGEAIAWHIAEEVDAPGKVIHRALFNDLSRETVLRSLSHPTKLDCRKVEAQIARRVLDRLVGYEISPMLWKKVKRGLSAGRVQSVAVRLVCERQREIEAFEPQEYWTITAHLEGQSPPSFEVRLWRAHGTKVHIPDEAAAKEIEREVRAAAFIVRSVEVKPTQRKPPPPFTTSKLQQEAYRRLRFPAKKTMTVAQQLYEGVEVDSEGLVGLITYMRTDSVRVADHALQAVRSHIGTKFGKEYLPRRPNQYRSRKGAQEAHEAIRPTQVDRHPDAIQASVSADQHRLYRLIWERFVASQMKPAEYDRTTVEIEAGPYLFRGVGAVMTFPGFTAVYGREVDGEAGEDEGAFPVLHKGETLKLLELRPRQHFTQPPPPFTEATLVKELEEQGIGRPSTYATILSNIRERGYATVDKGAFRPTELGLLVTDLLVRSFPAILDLHFTAEMEGKLDRIEEGELDRLQVLRTFYESFRKDYEKAEVHMQDLKREGLSTGITCEACGSEMVIKMGRKGPFLSCSAYPKCTFSRPYKRDAQGHVQTAAEEPSGEQCPKCGAAMVVKEGRFGRFLACSRYPECRSTLPLKGETADRPAPEETPVCPKCGAPTVLRRGPYGRFFACQRYPECRGTVPVKMGVKCPRCKEGQLVEKRSKKGKVFYSCSQYPKCRFALWDRPLARTCPNCGASLMVERRRKSGTTIACINKECGYAEAEPQTQEARS